MASRHSYATTFACRCTGISLFISGRNLCLDSLQHLPGGNWASPQGCMPGALHHIIAQTSRARNLTNQRGRFRRSCSSRFSLLRKSHHPPPQFSQHLLGSRCRSNIANHNRFLAAVAVIMYVWFVSSAPPTRLLVFRCRTTFFVSSLFRSRAGGRSNCETEAGHPL